MGATFTVALDSDLVGGTLSGLIDKADDMSPLMATIGNILEASTKERLRDTNTSPDGIAWPSSLRAQTDGGKTLYESGALANSIHNVPGPNQVELGSNLIYAGVHQDGATITPKAGKALQFELPDGSLVTVGSVTIPDRPYLGISDTDREDIADAIAFYFDLGEGP